MVEIDTYLLLMNSHSRHSQSAAFIGTCASRDFFVAKFGRSGRLYHQFISFTEDSS